MFDDTETPAEVEAAADAAQGDNEDRAPVQHFYSRDMGCCACGWAASNPETEDAEFVAHLAELGLVWCETCEHVHIAAIPSITHLCRDCGWGQWHSRDARAHRESCPGHRTYRVGHVISIADVGMFDRVISPAYHARIVRQRDDAVAQAERQRDAVLAIHRAHGDDELAFCLTCGIETDWPCPTAAALGEPA